MSVADKPYISPIVSSKRLDVVDGLRGLAILAVIYQHGFSTSLINYIKRLTGADYLYVLGNGWMGVSFFFVLSGFVLSLPYFSGSRDISANNAIRTYYIHRAKRLIPLFIFMAFISLAFYIHNGDRNAHKSFFMVISSASMFTTDYFFPKINAPFWSLLVEIFFSALLPIILISIMKYGLKKTALCVIILALVIRIPGAYFEFLSIHVNPIKDFFLARCDDFIAGMIVGYLYVKGRLPNRPALFFFSGILLILVASTLWDLRLQNLTPKYFIAFANNFANAGFALILAAALQSKGVLSKCLSIWPLRIIGAMCFSIYCWHGLLIGPQLLGEPHNLTNELQFWVTLLALSAATYRYIEFPNEKSLKKLFLIR